jgi:hypothetical protein
MEVLTASSVGRKERIWWRMQSGKSLIMSLLLLLLCLCLLYLKGVLSFKDDSSMGYAPLPKAMYERWGWKFDHTLLLLLILIFLNIIN